jgi:uncharacterized protein YbjQ (UPF0145 family)
MDPISLGIPSVLIAAAFYLSVFLMEKALLFSLRRKVALGEATFDGFEVSDLSDPVTEDQWNQLAAGAVVEAKDRTHLPARIVTGSVVLTHGLVYQIWVNLRGIFGGRIGALDEMISLGRRLAMIRMIQEASDLGYRKIVRVRFEASPIINKQPQDPAKPHGLELLVYGSAIA